MHRLAYSHGECPRVLTLIILENSGSSVRGVKSEFATTLTEELKPVLPPL